MIWAFADGLCWAIGLGLVTFIRFDFDPAMVDWRGLGVVLGYAILGQLVAGLIGGLYSGRLRFASFEEAGTLGLVGVAVGGALCISLLTISGARPIPLSGAAGGTGVAVVLMFGSRYLVRLARHLGSLPNAGPSTGLSSSAPARVATRPPGRCCAIPTPPCVPSPSSTTTRPRGTFASWAAGWWADASPSPPRPPSGEPTRW